MPNAWQTWLSSPLFGIVMTVSLYTLSLSLNARWHFLHPLAITSGTIILFLAATGTPYEAYANGGELITFFLGPATVALGVPLYKQRKAILANIKTIVGSISVGSIVGISSCWLFIAISDGSRELLLATLPKSATSAISVGLASSVGGSPELTAVLTVLTGLAGSMLGPMVLRLIGIDGALPVGLAIGTAAHGIGTARLLRDDTEAGGFSGLAMGITGIIISFLMIPVSWLLALLP